MEPERPIESLLRALAKKRRAESGDGFDPHPATRRLLQGEVARLRKPRERGAGFLRRLGWMRPGRVFAICLFASLLLSAFLFLPVLGIAKKKSSAAIVMNTVQQNHGPEPMPAAPAREEYAAKAATTRAYLDADVAAARSKSAAPAVTGSLASATTATPPPPALVQESAPLLSANEGVTGGQSAPSVRRFSADRFGSQAENRFKNSVAPAQTSAPVLANFELRQDGSTLAVVDEDGSIYNGYLVPEDAATLGISEKDQARSAAAKAAEPQPTLKDELNASLQNYAFRVTGINRSLKQTVVFTGNLITTSNTPTPKIAPGDAGIAGETPMAPSENQMQQALKQKLGQLQFVNTRIAGTAIVGRTNKIEINAVPVGDVP